jgi:transposase-like protein
MITAEMRAQMRRLVLVDGWRIETVSRRFGVHHSVVRRALREELDAKPPGSESRLDPFKPYIVQRLTELPSLSSVRLHAELSERGLSLGIAQVRRYVAQVRPPQPRRAYLRIEIERKCSPRPVWCRGTGSAETMGGCGIGGRRYASSRARGTVTAPG